jgi:hypothetical protein
VTKGGDARPGEDGRRAWRREELLMGTLRWLGLAAGAILVAVAVRAAESEPLRIMGKVKSVASDGRAFDLVDARGALAVELEPKAEVTLHRATPIGGCAPGATIYVLGVKREAGRRQKAFVQDVQAIVVGDGFSPPALPSGLAEKKLEWVKGKLALEGGRPRVGAYELHAPADRLVLRVSAAPKDALAPGRLVFVEGTPRGEPGPRAAAARKVALLDPQIPEAELHAALGL